MTIDQNIFADNMEKYKDPELYDQQYEGYMKDYPLFAEWAGRQGGPVIDLACGTGRITLPLAEAGYEMIAVDLNEGMLVRARQKSDERGLPIQWHLQDCTQLNLHVKSPFIFMTGNSFQHFLTNESQSALLTSIHKHLETNGIFIFGTRFPHLKDLLGDENESKRFDSRNRMVTERQKEVYDPMAQILHCTSEREIKDGEGSVLAYEKDSISLRYVFPKEMESLLSQNGFRIEAAYGTWDKKPLSGEHPEMIYVCRKA